MEGGTDGRTDSGGQGERAEWSNLKAGGGGGGSEEEEGARVPPTTATQCCLSTLASV